MRVPRTAHVLPATPLAYNPCPCTLRHPRGLVSPGSSPARALPACSAVARPSLDRCVSAILKPRRPPSPTPSGPTPLCPTPPPAATRPLLPNYTAEEKEAGIHERYLQNPGVKVLQLGKAS